MVNCLPDAHFVQVVLKLFAAVQANDVALAVRLARLGDWRCGMAGRCAAFAAKSTRMRISSGVAAAAGVAAPYGQVFHGLTWGPDPPCATPTAVLASNRST